MDNKKLKELEANLWEAADDPACQFQFDEQ